MPNGGITLFYSYSHADEALRVQLAKHLKMMERQGLLQSWSDRDISAGSEWRGQIDQHLKDANIVLLLISPDFISSDYCYDVELAHALRRHNSGECAVVPIFLREVDISGAPFAELQGLPEGGVPVTSWPNQDEAFADVARNLRRIVLGLGGDQGISSIKEGPQEPSKTSGQDRDIQRIAKYWGLFDRPSFTIPCIFEESIEAASEACDQITSAMLTGKLAIRQYLDERLLIDLPPKNSFETEPFVSALTQVRNYVSDLKGTVNYLRVHLSHTDGSPVQSHQSADHIYHMEFFLVDLIEKGASQQFAKKAFDIMDRIDSERNAIIELMNGLFHLADLRQLPPITLSSQLLQLSAQMRPYSWDKFFLRAHEYLGNFLESGKREGQVL